MEELDRVGWVPVITNSGNVNLELITNQDLNQAFNAEYVTPGGPDEESQEQSFEDFEDWDQAVSHETPMGPPGKKN